MNRIESFLKSTKSKKIIIMVFSIIGICLIVISYTSKVKDETQMKYSDTYGEGLEKRTEEVLETIIGKDTTEVMITFKNTFIPASSSSDKSTNFTAANIKNVYTEMPCPEIAGVMIACKSLENIQDINTVKEAVSICLNVPKNKIYIIGGYADYENN